MLKPTSNYRMSKQNKWLLAQELDSHVRGALKRGIIDADLSAAIKPAKDKKERDTTQSSTEG